jgi:predicted Holliday junction resolvase-like endonuclease
MTLLYVLVISLIFINITLLLLSLRKSDTKDLSESRLESISSKIVTLQNNQSQQIASLDVLPTKVLRTIQGSVNSTTGKMGELVKFIELQRMYDRLIPVGSIVDFIGVSFPADDKPGTVAFIDVKTGKRAVLSKEQKILKNLIDKKLITFNVVKVEVE